MEDPLKNKFPGIKSFEDFRAEISIIELATANGYVHEAKKGRRTPVFYHPRYHDRIIIVNPGNTAKQGYWNPADDTDKGSLVNFVRRRLGSVFSQHNGASEFANVNNVLYQYLRLDPFIRNRNRQAVDTRELKNVKAAPFLLDYYKLRPLTHTGFLRQREISPDTLRQPEFSGRIFNVQRADPARPAQVATNVAFPYYVAGEDKIVGLEIRNKQFKNHALGSDRSHGVWHSNVPPVLKRIVLLESALDALAYHELKKEPNTLYVSYGGNLTVNQVHTIRELRSKAAHPGMVQFIAAGDNDRPGAAYDLLFIRSLASFHLPSQRLASPPGIIRLAFSGHFPFLPPAMAQEALHLFAGELAKKLQPYNDALDQVLNSARLSPLVRQEIEQGKIRYGIEGEQCIITLPDNFFALNAFNHQLIQAAGLAREIRIDKALLKDYNDDLKLLKQVNRNAPLLAELNKEILHQEPQRPLHYPDLHFVLQQPGRQEQVSQALNPGNAKQPDTQALPPEKPDNLPPPDAARHPRMT